jgi:hypothetical protein
MWYFKCPLLIIGGDYAVGSHGLLKPGADLASPSLSES